jgi:hypothetical protein
MPPSSSHSPSWRTILRFPELLEILDMRDQVRHDRQQLLVQFSRHLRVPPGEGRSRQRRRGLLGIRREHEGDSSGVSRATDAEVAGPGNLHQQGAPPGGQIRPGEREDADQAILVEVIVRGGADVHVHGRRIQVLEHDLGRGIGAQRLGRSALRPVGQRQHRRCRGGAVDHDVRQVGSLGVRNEAYSCHEA